MFKVNEATVYPSGQRNEEARDRGAYHPTIVSLLRPSFKQGWTGGNNCARTAVSSVCLQVGRSNLSEASVVMSTMLLCIGPVNRET